MPYAPYAIWFPAVDAILIAGEERRSFDSCCERDAAGHTRFLALRTDGISNLRAASGASFWINARDDGSIFKLELDSEIREVQGLYLIQLDPPLATENATLLRFIRINQQACNDANIEDHLRKQLPEEQLRLVRRIWASPLVVHGNNLRLGPAQLLQHPTTRWWIEVSKSKAVSALKTRFDLVVGVEGRGDSRVHDYDLVSPSPVDRGAVILLVWRSIFSGRLSYLDEPSGYLRNFQHNLGRLLRRTINLRAEQPRAVPPRLPIARGYFFRSTADLAIETETNNDRRYSFEGPIDVNDIVLLCVASSAAAPIRVALSSGFSGELHPLVMQGVSLTVCCWRAEPDRFFPMTWEDAQRETRGGLEAQLLAELQDVRDPSMPVVSARDQPAWMRGSRAADGGECPEASAVAATGVATEITAADVLAFDPQFRSSADEWFASLSPIIMREIRTAAAESKLSLGELVKLLPIDLTGFLVNPRSWSVLERDAAELLLIISHTRELVTGSNSWHGGNVRIDSSLWLAVARARDELRLTDDRMTADIIKALAPDQAGSLKPLPVVALKAAKTVLNNLNTQLAHRFRPSSVEPLHTDG